MHTGHHHEDHLTDTTDVTTFLTRSARWLQFCYSGKSVTNLLAFVEITVIIDARFDVTAVIVEVHHVDTTFLIVL